MAVLQPHEVRELTLTAITAVASDDFLAERLVLKGGNALQLVYGIGYRASVDLDFSIAGDIDPEELKIRLGRALDNRFGVAGYTVFDFKFGPRPPNATTKTWGGYTAEFKLMRRDEAVRIEAAELTRLAKKSRKEHRNPTTRAAHAAPAALSDLERLDAWRRNSPQRYTIDVSKYEYIEGDRAFSREQRRTKLSYRYDIYEIYILSGMATKKLVPKGERHRIDRRIAPQEALDLVVGRLQGDLA